MPFLAFPLLIEEGWEGSDNIVTAPELFSRLFQKTVDEFHMTVYHPLRRPVHIRSAEKLESGTHADHDAVVQMRFQPVHELFLLRSTQGNPDDFRAVLFNHRGNTGIVEFTNAAERQLNELHIGHIRIYLRQLFLQTVEHRLLRPEEDHPVFARAHNVLENLASRILWQAFAVNPPDVEGHETAVAGREQAAVDYCEVILVSVGDIHNDPVGRAHIVRTRLIQPPSNRRVNFGGVNK